MSARFSLVLPIGLAVSAAIVACASSSDEEKQTNAVASATAVKDCLGGPRPNSGFGLVPTFGGQSFANPVAVLPLPGDDDHFLVVRKTGSIHRVATDGAQTLFVDMADKINSSPNEAGLLGVALHPSFATNGLVFLSYTKPSATSPANLRSVIARAKSNDGGLTLDKSSLVELMQFDQPYSNHNGGHLAFGHDGFLYASFGDGGSGGDPLGNGQKKDVYFGKILRLDIDHGDLYSIPADNPFANGGGKPEIYAYGLRNTWRFSFDKLTGELWAGDVGQNKYEEVDRIQLGGNYGWGVREGLHCYKTEPCPEVPGAIHPVVEYDHSQGFSITGGFVYRGSAIPDLVGQYVFGDFGGKIWSISTVQSDAPPAMRTVAATSMSISSFGQDNKGELFVLDYGSGKIHRLVQQVSSDGLPVKLSQTGCFEATSPKVPTAKLLPYDVVSPLWSDGAEKARWMSLPANGKISLATDGDFDLPVGTVLVKEFKVGGKRIETRLFVRHTDSSWAGYTYEWDDAETDATLLVDGKQKDVPGAGGSPQRWTYPSRAQCMTCHNSSAGSSLGLELAQLNRDGQLERWTAQGLFAAPLPAGYTAPLPSPADELLRPETRARSYLHANCSFCHRPGGPGRGAADFRFSRSFEGTHVCNAEPEAGDLGVAGAKLFVPGDPGKSLISLRTHTLDQNRMPPLASAIVDPMGTAIIDGWISSVTTCE
ncbi:MAG: PQQ-dependent sugar dehydrogenase [Labilithrix sp.]